MYKKVIQDKICYIIQWSPIHNYHRVLASRILPDMPGLLLFVKKQSLGEKPILAYATWRDGLRMSMRDLFDPAFSKCPEIMSLAQDGELYYRYSVIDTNQKDLRDVFYWTLRTYQPELNTVKGFTHTGRYKEVLVKEEMNATILDRHSAPPGFERN